ncbi:MAG: hypothetical protein AAFO58_09735, partial [Pseudomonadota bacterium]
AELNGWPGPAHVLEFRVELDLREDQVARTQEIFEAMQAAAIKAGARLIAAERALDQAFETRTVYTQSLAVLLEEAATARGALRYVHLSRHLAMDAVLTDDQRARYDRLRGYANDPCAQVPEGHNAAMWRRHNGCDG